MRYYLIQIFPPGSDPGSAPVFREYTSFPNGQSDPGALNIVLDIYQYTFGDALPLSVVQIYGIDIRDVSQVSNFTNCNIMIWAGFQKGLPLNNSAQAGLLLSGIIWQAFGNWQGTEMVLDFVVSPPGAIAAQNTNFSFSWTAGTPLSSALATTLTNGFPKIKQNIQISPNLIIGHDENGVYQSMPPFAQTLKSLTAAAIGGTYPGVDIIWTPTQINVFDGTAQQTPKQIAFQDLIGQPVWIGPLTIQFMCPMRADISVGTFVTMPKASTGGAYPAYSPGAAVTTSAAQPQARQSSIFNGTFNVILVHHMGIFRQPDGTAWVTVFNAYVTTPEPVPTVTIESLSFGP